jgi:repressor LexA
MEELTGRQKEILAFIEDHVAGAGHAPTVREIAQAFHISIGPVQRHIKALARKGHIIHRPGISRGMDLARRKPLAGVPLLGRVPAGPPTIPYEDVQDHVYIDKKYLAGGSVCFALRVRGDSMTGAGIFEGDVIVVRQQQAADDGDIVVALVDGEATVKTLRRRGGEVFLEPANPKYAPIHGREIRVMGKVVHLTREY